LSQSRGSAAFDVAPMKLNNTTALTTIVNAANDA